MMYRLIFSLIGCLVLGVGVFFVTRWPDQLAHNSLRSDITTAIPLSAPENDQTTLIHGAFETQGNLQQSGSFSGQEDGAADLQQAGHFSPEELNTLDVQSP